MVCKRECFSVMVMVGMGWMTGDVVCSIGWMRKNGLAMEKL